MGGLYDRGGPGTWNELYIPINIHTYMNINMYLHIYIYICILFTSMCISEKDSDKQTARCR